LTAVENDAVTRLRQLAGLATPMALRVAVTLGLPDRLRTTAGPADLAAELDVHPVALELLLGHLVTLGALDRTGTGYRTTDFGAHLGEDAGTGLADLLHLDRAGGRGELAFTELRHSVVTGEAGYPRRYGTDFWTDLATHPELRESFDRQMTHRIRTQLPAIVAGVDWARFGTIVDVGGGHGTLLAAILTAHPVVRGHLIDLDPTAEGARRTFADHGLTDRTEVTAASFFDPLPRGADAYLLADVLHDWDDPNAHRILARCAEALPPDGRVLVLEAIGGLRANSEMDLVMLTCYGSRERTLAEFRALAAPHGLAVHTVTPLTDVRCLLELRIGA
jgi:2,7-dihydroxy-5-methyl-1-naphthoate 7-O-methyltransferase